MPNRYNQLIAKLAKKPMSINEFETFLGQIGGLFADIALERELIKQSGIPLYFTNHQVFLKTTLTPYLEQKFCIVDIETNGHNPYLHQPIEIGAILYQNNKILDTYSTLIYNPSLPDTITKLTGITPQMLKDAPKIHQVLESFKLFLGDSIFVAHNVDFDFNFLSQSYHHNGFGYLYNTKLCTIKLARKLICSPRYSLGFLNTFLNINHPTLHRALDDCLVALEVFKIALKELKPNIHTSYDLLQFVQNNPKSN
ncbi:MAG: 3'-5' exonuclease [Helicobacter sp.]|nr:3'-5' exonuclease [Helicobacter sp.]